MAEAWEEMARRMVESQVRGRGVADERVLAALAQIPRHRFVPEDPVEASKSMLPGTLPGAVPGGEAYEDRALSIGLGQTISQPFMVARMTELLEMEPGMNVLEVGTGSGYQTAVLARLGARVVSIECSPQLAQREAVLTDLGLADRVRFILGDGTLGWPEGAPYDRILVTAGAPRLPEAYRGQLADRGRIVIPLGPREEQELFVFTRYGDKWIRRPMLACRFVSLVGADGWPE